MHIKFSCTSKEEGIYHLGQAMGSKGQEEQSQATPKHC